MGILDFDFRFSGISRKNIDEDTIMKYISREGATRICFASTHAHSFHRTIDGGDVKAWFNLPFHDTVKAFLESETGGGVTLYRTKNGKGYCYPAKSETSLQSIDAFMQKYRETVFLCDNLELSVALSMHETEPGIRTLLGEAEYQVKYRSVINDTSEARDYLQQKLQEALDGMPFFKYADYICAVPSSKPFLGEMVANLNGWDEKNISDHLVWTTKNKDLKNINSVEEKMAALKDFGLTINDVDLKDKVVVLVDDMYKSGLTMQFIAMKLKELGAKYIFGISLVKALGNK